MILYGRSARAGLGNYVNKMNGLICRKQVRTFLPGGAKSKQIFEKIYHQQVPTQRDNADRKDEEKGQDDGGDALI